MKTIPLSVIALLALAFSPAVSAGAGKTYQVTGPILKMTDSMIAVQKGSDRWEIARDASTKGATGLKVGDKVTIHYTMKATEVESKADKAAAPEKK